ncbi:MAG: hypothetical protein M1818_000016 [Claussenomyces sp. TS43310]|nr:MAG: hypothetical protein M1818_000016 [Claussenomyces sp. TS43310]
MASVTSLPAGIDCEDIIGFGTTGLVARFPNTNKVIKIPHGGDPEAYARFLIETRVYERFKQSPNRPASILQYFSGSDKGIILENAENATVRHYLHKSRDSFHERLLVRWAKQAAESLVFCHSEGILHGDINCGNLFLDRDLNLKLGDFSGSSVDQSPALVCYSTTHQLPDDLFFSSTEAKITEEMEVFAFGSTLYEMITGSEPYSDQEDAEVETLFRQKTFPDVSGLGMLGSIICGCWYLDFHCMADVLSSIEAKGLFPNIISVYLNSADSEIF